MKLRWALITALGLGGCVVYEDRHSIDEPPDRAISHLYAGQMITLSLTDGSAIDVTYRGSAPNELIVSRRETFGNKELHFAFSQVKSVHSVYTSDREVLPLLPGGGYIPLR